MSDEQEIREAVNEAKAPGTFNIVSVLQGRAYPKTEVVVYLDEAIAYEASLVQDKIDELDTKIGKGKMTEKQSSMRDELINQKEELADKMRASAYTVEISGISEGKREEIFAQAKKRYPIEYENSSNMAEVLLGGDNKRTEKESPERDNLFTDLLWQESIKKITDPEGNIQTEFPYASIKEMRNSFPLSAIMNINQTIEKMRAAAALFVMETGEDFLAKP